MDNLTELHEKQDKFIKETFAEDKVINSPIFENYATYIDNTKVKVKKYTHKQIRIIILLAILLIISLIINIYFYFTKDEATSQNHSAKNTTDSEMVFEIDEDSLLNNDSENNKVTENTITKNEVSNSTENRATATIRPVEKAPNPHLKPAENVETNHNNEVIIEELNDLLTSYAFGINRVTNDPNDLESNTILLFIAKNYFNNKTIKSNSSVDYKNIYASTKENIHSYLEELTGIEFTNMNSIPSFNNYIGYMRASNSYTYGKDAKDILKEKYSVSDTKITNEAFGQYTAECHITRTTDGIDTNYDVELKFKLNDEYTYTKYNIISLKAKNTSFQPDNTLRLIDNKDLPKNEVR